MAQRPFNCKKTNDHDFVKPPTNKRTTQKLPDLSKWETYPSFKPLKLDDRLGASINLDQINWEDPIELFNQFFPSDFIQYCVRCTNANAKRIQHQEAAGRARWSRFRFATGSRVWKPITADAIYAYLGIYLYINLYSVPRISDYWTTDSDKPNHERVRQTMSRNR